ncbi:MAG TPA: hypothetical protein VFQ35_03440 [Polyangiaceae bacterium]|nr:hypothetical protein [Polyangiaceae bacterium]
MRSSSSTWSFAAITLMLGGCSSSTPSPAQSSPPQAEVRASNQRARVSKSAAAEDEAESVPSELAAMLEPRTCQPTLLNGTHFRELKDGKGRPHRAFLISPGEELCLIGSGGGDERNGSLSDLELSEDPVPLEKARERLISVELRTLEMGSVLVVKNHHRATLQFHGSMLVPHQLDLVSTSVCPVMPGRFSVEHWPDPLSSLLLTDFTLHDPSEQLGCE